MSRAPRTPAIFLILSLAAAIACATGARVSEPPSAESTWIRDAVMYGPTAIRGRWQQRVWQATVGILTFPFWNPWFFYDYMLLPSPPEDDWELIKVAAQLGHFGSEPFLLRLSCDSTLKLHPVPDVHFGRFYALVIGNDEYRDLNRLNSAVHDAERVATVLRAFYSFEVTLIRNATRAEIVSELNHYRSLLRRTDNLLIYYAGHGYVDPDTDEGYWLPVDSNRDSPVNWVSNATITTSLRGLPARHVLVVSDSCFAGSLTAVVPSTRGVNSAPKPLETPSRMVLTSGGLEPVTDGGGRGHSVFARHFLDSLESNCGVLTAFNLYSDLAPPVTISADQHPALSAIERTGHEGGEFRFVRRH
jgi:hypothetical protein